MFLESYLPIIIFLIIGAGFGLAPLIASFVLGVKRPDKSKASPYECGFDPLQTSRLPFDIRFYLIAILFILFDLETAFLFPWAVSLRKIGGSGLLAMLLFLAVLLVGFLYEWLKGALEWE